MNIGAALLVPEMYGTTTQDMIEDLSSKIGGFSIYLGIMLFLNMYLLFRGKRKAGEKRRAEKRSTALDTTLG